jgi:hypothetical protein
MDWSADNSLQNNIFTWNDNGTDYEVTIPQSMYDGPTLATVLEELMNDATAPGTYTVEYDNISALFQWTTVSGGDITVTPDATWPWLELGFCLGETVEGTGGVLTSTVVVHLEGTSHIFISIPEIQTANSIVYNGTSLTFVVPVNVASTYVNHWSYLTSPPSKRFTTPTDQTLMVYTIYLYFERAGTLWPLIGDCNASYTINLMYAGLQI